MVEFTCQKQIFDTASNFYCRTSGIALHLVASYLLLRLSENYEDEQRSDFKEFDRLRMVSGAFLVPFCGSSFCSSASRGVNW